MIRSIAKLTATSVLAAGFVSIVPAMLDANAAPARKGQWNACPNDADSTRCVWDAKHMGNGTGRSYLVTKNGRVIYLPHSAVHQMLEGR